MPQFLIIATDFDGVISQRLAIRPSHLLRMKTEKVKGHFLLGGARLNASGEMYGSMLVIDLPDERAANDWLLADPYYTGKVWESWTITPFRLVDDAALS